MATTPRRRNNQTTSSTRAKKPTTIDLDAVEVEADGETTDADAKKKAADLEKKATEDVKQAAEPAATKKKPAPKSTPKSTPGSTRATAQKTGQTGTDSVKEANKTAANADNAMETPAVDLDPAAAPDMPDLTEKKSGNSGGGFGRLIAAGLIGSAITLGGAGYMQYAGYLPLITENAGISSVPEPVAMPDLAPLEAKLAELQSKLDNQPVIENPTVDLTAIETRLTNVEESVVKTLDALAAAETALANLSSDANSDGNLQLAREMAKIKADLSEVRASGQQLAIKLAALPQANPNNQVTPENISEVVTPLLSPLASAEQQNTQAINELQNNINAISSRIDKELVTRIEQIDTKLQNAATGERLAKSVAVNALKSALESGKPYSAALASVETLTGASKPLEQLRQKASAGVATKETLLNEFHEMQSKLLLAANNDGNAGLKDRVMFSIKSLVTISSDEPLPGDTPEAIISRIDAGLKNGNLQQALVEWKSLPQSARSISQTWADKVQQRISADQQMLELMKSIQTTSTAG